MLEAGPPRIPTRDFTEHVWPYRVRFRGFGDTKTFLEKQPVQRLCDACDEYSNQFFVDDTENPYTSDPDKPFMWIRRRIGRSEEHTSELQSLTKLVCRPLLEKKNRGLSNQGLGQTDTAYLTSDQT